MLKLRIHDGKGPFLEGDIVSIARGEECTKGEGDGGGQTIDS